MQINSQNLEFQQFLENKNLINSVRAISEKQRIHDNTNKEFVHLSNKIKI